MHTLPDKALRPPAVERLPARPKHGSPKPLPSSFMRVTPPPVSSAVPAHQRRKETRAQDLQNAALALFVEKGFTATRIDEVAHRAGVSKGTLYLYYASKDELLLAVVRQNLITLITEGPEFVDAYDGSSADLLSDLLNGWWQRFGLSPASGVLKIIVAEARNFPALAQCYADEVITRANQLLSRALQRGVSSGEFRPVPVAELNMLLMAPLIFLGLHQHSLSASALREHRFDLGRVVRTHVDVALRGMMVRPVHVSESHSPGPAAPTRKPGSPRLER